MEVPGSVLKDSDDGKAAHVNGLNAATAFLTLTVPNSALSGIKNFRIITGMAEETSCVV
jgi:hypothetical protein